MNNDLKLLFLNYLSRLGGIVEKVPENVFPLSLTEGMFSLALNTKVAANFALRGCCPLAGEEVVSFIESEASKGAVLKQISATQRYIEGLPAFAPLDENVLLEDKAGFTQIKLPQSQFIHHYIIPNMLFHMSMVYAIARANGVPLSKGDFDGLHSYPEGFVFG